MNDLFSVRAHLTTASTLALAAMFMAGGTAQAGNECGSPVNDSVTCTAASYPGGISYTGMTIPLILTVDTPSGTIGDIGISNISSDASTILGTNVGTVTLSGPATGAGMNALVTSSTSTGGVNGVLSAGSISTSTNKIYGLIIQTSGLGDVTAQMTGGSVTTGYDNAHAVYALSANVSSTATVTAELTSGSISTTGDSAQGLIATSAGRGPTRVIISGGSISTMGDASYGVRSSTGFNSTNSTAQVLIDMSGGTISTRGNEAYGLYGLHLGAGDSVVNMSGGTLTTYGPKAYGIFATSAAGNARVTFSGSASIDMTLPGADVGDDRYAINAVSQGDGDAVVDVSGGTIRAPKQALKLTAAGNGDATATIMGGTLTTTIDGAAVFAQTGGSGAASAIVNDSNGPVRISAGTTLSNPVSPANTNAHTVEASILTGGTGTAYASLSGGIGSAILESFGSSGRALLASADDGPGAITSEMFGGSILLHGNNASGVSTTHSGYGDATSIIRGGQVDIDNGLVSTSAVFAQGNGKVVTQMTGGTLLLDGSTDMAGIAGGSAVTVGLHPVAMSAMSEAPDPMATAEMSGGVINATGFGSVGVTPQNFINGKSTTNLTGGTITVSGDGLSGIAFLDRSALGSYPAHDATVNIGPDMVVDASASSFGYAIFASDPSAGNNLTVTSEGTVIGDAVMGSGGSTFTLAGGSWTGDIYGDFDPLNRVTGLAAANQGDDNFIWTGGTLNSGFYGQGGNDTAMISVANPASVAAAIFDGGEDGGAPESRITSDRDEITFATDQANLAGRNIKNWEQFTLNENVAIAFVDSGMALDGYDGGNANDLGDLSMLNGSRLTAGAGRGQSFNLSGNLTNRGVLSMQDGAYGGNFIVGGDYDSKKGRLAVDVDFGALQSDVLTVGGKIDGVTEINIADVGTRGSLGSILLVDMTNSTAVDQNEFVIEDEKNNMTASGIYAYSLEYDLDGDPGNGYAPGLYLTSYQDGPVPPGPTPPGPTPPGPVPPGPTPPGPTPPGPTPPGPTPPGPVPPAPNPPKANIQPYVPLYEGYQSVLLDMNSLPTMRQRIGKRYWLYDDMAMPAAPMKATEDVNYSQSGGATVVVIDQEAQSTPTISNVWGRVDGGFSHLDPTSTIVGYDYDLSLFEMQTGLDGLFLDNDSGRLIAGLTAHYLTGEAKFASRYGDSSMHPDGYGFGATATWFSDNGFYTDAQAEATWYASELKAESLTRGVEDTNAFGYALSMEAGQQFGFGNDLIATPQAQLVYSSVDADSFTGAYSDDVTFETGESLTARLGLALERESQWKNDDGLIRKGNIYGIANVYYEFMGETKAQVEGFYGIASELDDWTGELGFGGAYDWADNGGRLYGVYAEITASTGFGSGSYSYGGNLGLKAQW